MLAIRLRGASRRMREISLFVTFLFPFFVSSPRLQVATVDRFSRSMHQTTRFRARKCLLGVSTMNFHIYPPFTPKFENLHYGLWQLAGLYNGRTHGILALRQQQQYHVIDLTLSLNWLKWHWRELIQVHVTVHHSLMVLRSVVARL